MIYIIFYLITFSLIVAGYVLENQQNEVKKNQIVTMLTWLVAVGYILLLSLRGMTGTDTKSYLNIFENNLYDQFHIEWLPRLVMLTCSQLGLPFESVEVMFALLTVVPLVFVLKKYTSNSLIAMSGLYIYGYILLSFNISRQMIAVSFFVAAVLLLMNSATTATKIGAIVLSVLSVSFHSSAIIMLSVFLFIQYFATQKPKMMTKALPYVALFVVALAVVIYMFAPLEAIGAMLYHSGILGDNYSSYLRPDGRSHIFVRPAKLTMAMSILAAAAVFIRFKYLEIKKEKYDVSLSMLVLVYALLTSLNIGWISDRLSYYFLPFLSVLLVDVLTMKESKKTFKSFALLSLLLISLLIFKRMLQYNYGEIIPYVGVF